MVCRRPAADERQRQASLSGLLSLSRVMVRNHTTEQLPGNNFAVTAPAAVDMAGHSVGD